MNLLYMLKITPPLVAVLTLLAYKHGIQSSNGHWSPKCKHVLIAQ